MGKLRELRAARRRVQEKLTRLFDQRKEKLGDLPELIEKRDELGKFIAMKTKAKNEGSESALIGLADLKQKHEQFEKEIRRCSGGATRFHERKLQLTMQLDELRAKIDEIYYEREQNELRQNPKEKTISSSASWDDQATTNQQIQQVIDEIAQRQNELRQDPKEKAISSSASWDDQAAPNQTIQQVMDLTGKWWGDILLQEGDTAGIALDKILMQGQWPMNVELQLVLMPECKQLDNSYPMDDLGSKRLTLLQWLKP